MLFFYRFTKTKNEKIHCLKFMLIIFLIFNRKFSYYCVIFHNFMAFIHYFKKTNKKKQKSELLCI